MRWWILAAGLALSPVTVAGAETVEGVVATVGDVALLESDLELAALVRLVEPAAEESPAGYRSRLLDARIRLELQYRQLERSGALFRLEVDRTGVRSELERRADGGLATRLDELGLNGDDLSKLALRVAAVRAYVEQRLRPRVAPNRAQTDEAYQRLVDELAAAGVAPPPFAEVADQLQRLVEERLLNAEIELWLEQARQRLPVTRWPP